MKKPSLLTQVLVAFVVAVALGLIFGDKMSVVQPLGDLFLRLIKFIMAPLILTTLIVGVTSLQDTKQLFSMGGRTIVFYLFTTLIAVTIGIVYAVILSPGTGANVSLQQGATAPSGEAPTLTETLLNMIPENPFAALMEGNILQIIFMAIAIGLGILFVGEPAKPIQKLFESFSTVMFKITSGIMVIAPIGIFGMVAPIIGEYGLAVLAPLAKVIIAVALGCLTQLLVVYSLAVKGFAGMSPLTFLKGIAPAGLVAFSTASSGATLPVSMKNVQENLGVSKETASFVLPLGATMNMDGSAIYQGVAALFIAQFYGIDLGMSEILLIMFTTTIASIGTAGVPGAGMIMLTMVLAAVNLPVEGIALIAAIDRILDMFRTSVNIVGDAAASVVVDSYEKKSKEKANQQAS
ncbi:sodium:dicarboxylate symporter [Bacillus sp. VT 712]|uniref:Sodium:dicarboxylate symporter n=1 Tax=Priestia veravalensis TaxID=1414648 RepID=A0A0V8JQC9_9BACI|nr:MULTISPECIES: dicarboxylate/amino acid:cation symporter [Bacillaceae]AQX54579.1 sodium:dicarboxylate symporter [Priestia flexa]KSU89267.1 sodium:dicarboxylate symporter [Priestia veravalensis]KZB93437.1 sodium:dicarboxylate symporter [Bacillus sp. VT 712]MBY6085658.1 dicarboxylate/amino acid:cation symporter [Priestia flexa]MCG7313717.1 dicarboxylate/amino acid:cation symporter [Priestia flexa]